MMGPQDYLNVKSEQARLKAVGEVSKAFGSFLGWVAVIAVAVILLSVLSFALILLLGKLLGDYALGAFIVAGILLIVLVVLWCLRRKLFVGSFVRLLSEARDYKDLVERQKLSEAQALSFEKGLSSWNSVLLYGFRLLRRKFRI